MKINVPLLFVFLGSCFITCTARHSKLASIPADSGYSTGRASADGIGKFYFGREISQVMGAGGTNWLERVERNKEENTSQAIKNIRVAPDGIVADIGAGTGYFSFKIAARVPKGKVYAVEIQDEMIQYLQNKKALLRDSIVEIIKSTTISPNLPENSIDVVIMVDVYHELEFPQEMLRAISKCLKQNGQLVLIEYRGEDPAVPIKPLHKTTVAQLKKELGANGFQLSYKREFLPLQHFLVYEKK